MRITAWNAGSDAIVLNGAYWSCNREFDGSVLECALESSQCRRFFAQGVVNQCDAVPRHVLVLAVVLELLQHAPRVARAPGRRVDVTQVRLHPGIVARHLPRGSFELADRVSQPAHRHQVDPHLELGAVVAWTHFEGPAVFAHGPFVLARGSIRIADRNLCLHGERIEFASALRGINGLLVASTPPQ